MAARGPGKASDRPFISPLAGIIRRSISTWAISSAATIGSGSAGADGVTRPVAPDPDCWPVVISYDSTPSGVTPPKSRRARASASGPTGPTSSAAAAAGSGSIAFGRCRRGEVTPGPTFPTGAVTGFARLGSGTTPRTYRTVGLVVGYRTAAPRRASTGGSGSARSAATAPSSTTRGRS